MCDNNASIVVWNAPNQTDYGIFVAEYMTHWLPPEVVSDNSSSRTEGQKFAINNDNTGFAIWELPLNSPPDVYAAKCTLGLWTEETQLTNDNIGGINAQIAMSYNGDAIAVWQRYEKYGHSIVGRIYSSGVWSPIFEISNINEPNNTAHSPRVKMDNNGNIVVCWLQTVFKDQTVYSSSFTAGTWFTSGTWSTPTPISSTEGFHDQLDLALSPTGDAVCVWQKIDYGSTEIAEVGIIQCTKASF